MSKESEQASLYKYSHLSLNERLKIYWREGMHALFWGTVYEEVVGPLKAYLMSKYRLSEEDSLDCISEVLEGLVSRQEEPQSIEYPRRYIWQSSINSAVDLIKERSTAVSARQKLQFEKVTNRGKRNNRAIIEGEDDVYIDDDFGIGLGRELEDSIGGKSDTIDISGKPVSEVTLSNEGELRGGISSGGEATSTEGTSESDFPAESALYVIEGLIEDVEAEEHWAVPVIKKALTLLTPSEKKVVEAILMFGSDFISSGAQKEIGLSAVAFRQYKYRAYEKLREIIPQIMEDMGIVFRRHPDMIIFSSKHSEFPSGDESANAGHDLMCRFCFKVVKHSYVGDIPEHIFCPYCGTTGEPDLD